MSRLQKYLEQNPQFEGEEFLLKKYATAAIEVSEKTLERAAQKGVVTQKTIARKTYYSIKDLESFEEDYYAGILRGVPMSDSPRQTPTDSNSLMINPMQNQTALVMQQSPQDIQAAFMTATVEKAVFEANRAYTEGNLTFVLDEVCNRLNLSIVDMKRTAKTFRGKNQKLMITKANLENYIEHL